MIIAVDVGNTNTKILFFNEQNVIINKYVVHTSTLESPDLWHKTIDHLLTLNPNFDHAQLTISCVNWKIFLVLRVVFGYDKAEDFNINKAFDPTLLSVPSDSPLILESMIPLQRHHSGLIGSDRLLTAYAAYKMFHQSIIVVSLGSATTIDLITRNGEFFPGLILPGIESSYKGLLTQVPHLPSIESLSPQSNRTLCSNIIDSLSSGLFLGHALLIESLYHKQVLESQLNDSVNLLLTGGYADIISQHITTPHIVQDNMVAYGLSILREH